MQGITASRNYYPGDVIYTEEPFAKVVPRKLKNIVCEWCCQRPLILKACKQCLAVKYCGRACQKSDWSTHKLECVHLKKLPECINENVVRLLGKIILKIKDKDWKNIKKRVLGKDFSFDDIDSHYKRMTENRRMNLLYKELKEKVTSYIGKENMPGDVDLIKIIGKVRHNTFTTRALCFYIGMAMFDMECIPNTNAAFCEKNMEVWAIRRIKKGAEKITIPGQQVLSMKASFKEIDQKPCNCTDCSLPYGESVLTKIIDESRAYSVIYESEIFLTSYVLAADEFDPIVRDMADKLLRKQEGVLGSSNLLRLRLLAFRCLEIGDHPLLLMKPLLELEKSMRQVFGEYYGEMEVIYHTLGMVYIGLGNPMEGARYMLKAKEAASNNRN